MLTQPLIYPNARDLNQIQINPPFPHTVPVTAFDCYPKREKETQTKHKKRSKGSRELKDQETQLKGTEGGLPLEVNRMHCVCMSVAHSEIYQRTETIDSIES